MSSCVVRAQQVLSFLFVPALAAPAQTSASPTQTQILAAAFDVMKAARYCTLATVGVDGQPQARIVDPLLGRDNTIWIATNPLTRKDAISS